MQLSREAKEFLRSMLSREVEEQVERGLGNEPMSSAWVELYKETF